MNTDIFSSFYIQAFEVLNKIHGVDTQTTIDLLSTDNGGLGRVLGAGWKYGEKKLGLEDKQDFLGELMGDGVGLTISVEAKNDGGLKLSGQRDKGDSKEPFRPSSTIGVGSGMNKMSDQPLHGMLIRSVEIKVDTMASDKDGNEFKHTFVIPITVRTMVISTGVDKIINMLKPQSADKSFSARLEDYRAGAISLMDLMFASDLIKQYKENKLEDDEGLIELINSRSLSANSKMVDKDAIGFEKNYNMIIITTEDRVYIDKFIKGDIKKEKYKQQFLSEAHAITCTVIDTDYEKVFFLTSDIRGQSVASFKTLNKRKGGGNDLTEVMKAMMASRPPVF